MRDDGCICEPPDQITGGDGPGPDEACPIHGNPSMHQPYDVPLFPEPPAVLGIVDVATAHEFLIPGTPARVVDTSAAEARARAARLAGGSGGGVTT